MKERKNSFLLFCLLFVTLQGYAQKDSTIRIGEVVVTGTRNEIDIRHLPMSVSVINQKQITGRYEQSLLPLLTEQVPGLFTTGRGLMGYGVSNGAAGGMSMRGIGGTPTAGMLVLIDGHPQYMGLMGHPIGDAYQSMLAEKVEIVRGPASVLYGSNAMGGVINILTKKLKEDGVKNNIRLGYGSYNTFTSEGSTHIKKGRLSGIATISYNRSDNHRERMGFEQYGGYAKIGYEVSQAWNLFADVNLTHFNASNPGTIAIPMFDNDSRITRGMTSLSIENNYKYSSGALKFFYNWGHHNINDGYRTNGTPLDFRFNSNDKMLGINWYQSISLFKGNRLTVGFDYQLFGGNAWNKYLDGRTSDIIDKQEDEIAGYVDFRQSIGNILTFDAGVRLDNHSRTGVEWIPQVGVSLYPMKSAEVKMLVSKGFRNPTIRELYMFRPKNPDLLPERIMNYEISYSHRLFDNAFFYGINLFYINGSNMIQAHEISNQWINTGKVENWGVEATASYKISSSFTVSANYSWLRMKYPILAAPEHKAYAGLDFSKGRWNASTGLQYFDGLYTSITPEIKEDAVLWSVRGSYKFCSWADLFVRGENLLSQHYEINAGYPMPLATVFAGINMNF